MTFKPKFVTKARTASPAAEQRIADVSLDISWAELEEELWGSAVRTDDTSEAMRAVITETRTSWNSLRQAV